MLASLPMYDLPEIRDATNAFWAGFAKAYGVDMALTRGEDWTTPWHDPELLFSQTCGYPFTHEFAGVLKYVATPHYDADGCEGPLYRSIVVARSACPLAALKGKIAAFNNRDSMSGMLALQLVFAPLAGNGRFFSGTVETGGHVASLAAVQSGKADVCAADCVTVAYLRRYRPAALAGLVEIGRSPLVPGLPFVTRARDLPNLQDALSRAFELCNGEILEALLLKDVSVLNPEAYEIILHLEKHMKSIGGLRVLEMDGVDS